MIRMPAAWHVGDRLGDLGARRVEERDEAEQAELALGVLAALAAAAPAGSRRRATASTRSPCDA